MKVEKFEQIKFEKEPSRLEKAVWKALMEIPRGETRNYSQVAEMAGFPKAVRAVASAIGRNPMLVLIPCHRVIRKDGGLGGFAMGLEKKRELLRAEGVDF